MGVDSNEVCGFESGRFAFAVRRLYPKAPVIDDIRLSQPGELKIFIEKIAKYKVYKNNISKFS